MKLSELKIRNQEKVLKKLISLCDDSPTFIITRPVNFTDNFKFISVDALTQILSILENKKLISVLYADYPDNFNIAELYVTPDGYSYSPEKNYINQQKWKDRIIGFVFGTILGSAVTYFLPLLFGYLMQIFS